MHGTRPLHEIRLHEPARGNPGFYFVLRARNQRVVLISGNHAGTLGARDAIKAVRAAVEDPDSFLRTTGRNRTLIFMLLGPQGEVLGVSKPYSSTSARERGIATVACCARQARIWDMTTGTWDS